MHFYASMFLKVAESSPKHTFSNASKVEQQRIFKLQKFENLKKKISETK